MDGLQQGLGKKVTPWQIVCDRDLIQNHSEIRNPISSCRNPQYLAFLEHFYTYICVRVQLYSL